METQLNQVLVATASDLLCVHEMTLQFATRTKMNALAQIRIATTIIEKIVVVNDNRFPFGVQFVLHEHEVEGSVLRITSDGTLIAEFELDPGMSSELKTLPAVFWRGRRQLETAFQDMQQFTFAISHDLKNSLTKLKLALSLVEEEDMPPVIHNYVQIIHRSAVRLEKTMLSLNQVIELGHSSTHVVKKVSPELVFADVYDEFAESLSQIGASVTTDFSSVAEISYPEVYLKSILSNLMSNAVKYNLPGQPLQLYALAYREGKSIGIVFTDNGQGIDLKRFGNKLFQPFTRFSNDTEGSGLGLYLIKNIVERNGGTVEVESFPGKGTSFRFILNEYELPDGYQ